MRIWMASYPTVTALRNANVEMFVSSIELGGSLELLNRSVWQLAQMIVEGACGAPELR